MRRLVVPLVALVALTACGEGEPSAGTDDPRPEASASTAVPEEPSPTIRDVDLAGLEWREAVSEQHLTPVVDRADADPAAGPVVTVGEVIYGDVDGDGHEDAIAPLEILDGNSGSEIFYIWTWDAEAEEPVQVENPIARAHDCGGVVDEVTADPDAQAFVIHERLRRPGTEGSCADEPDLTAIRSVTLVDHWPVLTNGVGGYGGICPQPLGHDDTWPVEDTTLQAIPRDGEGVLDDPQLHWFAEADITGHAWLYREGWLLVGFGPFVGEGRDTHFAAYGDYTPCAWVAVDPSRHSEFGMLPPNRRG